MNIHTSTPHALFNSKYCQVIKSRNDLHIDRIDFIKDVQKGRLVIFLESEFLLNQEVNASLQENILIIEAFQTLDFEKPFKTHLIDREARFDYEEGFLKIGFSELQLHRGLRYTIISCRIINPGLLKVILSFQSLKNKTENIIH